MLKCAQDLGNTLTYFIELPFVNHCVSKNLNFFLMLNLSSFAFSSYIKI